jgi:hypothetical protein
MTHYDALISENKRKLLKAIKHLEYSYAKVQKLSADATKLDEESLETWEGFCSRFSRVADFFLSRFLRTYVLRQDPGFQGTLRDFVNQGEKLGLIDDAAAWMAIRELRNLSAHDYSEEDMSAFFERLRSEADRLIALKARLASIS